MSAVSTESAGVDWVTRSKNIVFDSHPFIFGEYYKNDGRNSFHTVNPATGAELAEFPDCNANVVDIAVRASRKAFQDKWSGLSPEQRKLALIEFADMVRAEREQLALLDCVEMGMPIAQALSQVDIAIDYLRFYAELADKIYGQVAPSDNTNTLAMTLVEPKGVIGIISPWNYPLLTAMTPIAPAIAAGNTVVVKPSEIAPSSVIKLAELASHANIPAGVLNVVTGRGAETGKALAKHMDVNCLHFTGSTQVGRKLLVYSGKSNGKPVILETGGKSPQIVFEDAMGLDDLGASLTQSAFANTGQLCVARTRLIVHSAIREEIVQAICAATKDVFVCGNPLQGDVSFGPLASLSQFNRVCGYLDLGKKEGATLRTLETSGEVSERGCFFSPTIVSDANSRMRIAQEEIFGPVMVVLSFSSEGEAIELANDVNYGLAATAWTCDLRRARRLMHRLRAGRVDIRTIGESGAAFAAHSAEPFGWSGYGVLGGKKGLDSFVQYKGVQVISD